MNKYRTSIKKEFGTEPAFTKWLSNNKEATESLLEVTDLNVEGEYQVRAEDITAEGKRIDLTIGDGDEVRAVVESQDASGWLDQNHLYKTLGYMKDKDTDTGIILCEDISEELKDHVADINENFEGKSIWVILNRLYKINNEVKVDFIPVISASLFDNSTSENYVEIGSSIDTFGSQPNSFNKPPSKAYLKSWPGLLL